MLITTIRENGRDDAGTKDLCIVERDPFAARGVRAWPLPHRSHRRFSKTKKPAIAAGTVLVFGLIVAYAALLFTYPALVAGMVGFGLHTSARALPDRDSYLGIAVSLPMPTLPALRVDSTFWTSVCCLTAMLALCLVRGWRTPSRYWLLGNAFVALGASMYAFYAGHVGYDSRTFILLVERTSILLVLAAPVFCAAVTSLLPYTILESLAMCVIIVLAEILLASVRLTAFVLLIGRFGGLVEANLYLFFGPIIDVLYFISAYSLVTACMAQRIKSRKGVVQWT